MSVQAAVIKSPAPAGQQNVLISAGQPVSRALALCPARDVTDTPRAATRTSRSGARAEWAGLAPGTWNWGRVAALERGLWESGRSRRLSPSRYSEHGGAHVGCPRLGTQSMVGLLSAHAQHSMPFPIEICRLVVAHATEGRFRNGEMYALCGDDLRLK